MMQAIPDWFERMTASKAETELSGFKFLGEGWYLSDTDSILVVKDYEDNYFFYIYNCNFNKIVFGSNTPVRKDDRS